ncbi:SPOSA6832_02124 [Sporobolomyces salmonicolor]|uniref:SPOSA6832_02124-mRNA-1:cds n=1 Tax=Sporidiobolus salmonicolor TaxID=5005 RepID=A0A0D6ELJ3_SPOSA|nr:SPOSA6832_02124 [Sporobolomyces salmonicolor]
MLTVPWSITSGWGTPTIKPYGPLALDPSATVLHYAPTLFEGMKAYKGKDGKTRLYRPELNMARMNRGAARMAFPTFEGEVLIELIKKLLEVDERWVPTDPGCSLYIRPTMIGTRASLGVGPSTEILLYVICSPVGNYFGKGAKPVSLFASTQNVRAWPGEQENNWVSPARTSTNAMVSLLSFSPLAGGTGAYKFGLNYGATTSPQLEAAQAGYQQILWLFGEDHEITEAGTMNAFIAFSQNDGSVTRDSILALARDHASGKAKLPGLPDRLVVSERKVTMGEIREAATNGTLVEVFGSGTAAIVTSVERIGFQGADIPVPVSGADGFGAIAGALVKRITAIQYGETGSEWSVVV